MAKQRQKVKRSTYDITPEEFIAVWQAADSAEEVSQRTGMPVPIVHARASSYRKQGVKLKSMRKKSKNALDVDHLNRVVEAVDARLARGTTTAAEGEQVDPAVDAVVQEVLSQLGQK